MASPSSMITADITPVVKPMLLNGLAVRVLPAVWNIVNREIVTYTLASTFRFIQNRWCI